MKLLIFILLMAVPFSKTLPNDLQINLVNSLMHSVIDEKFEIFLDKFKTIMKTGNPNYNIPVLDPLEIDTQTFSLEEKNLLNFTMICNDLRTDKLSEYNVKYVNVKFIDLNVTMAFEWPEIILKTKYDLHGTIGTKYPIFGKGNLDVNAKKLFVNISIVLSPVNNTMQIKKMKTFISLKKLEFYATGLYNDKIVSEFLSAVISETVPDILQFHQTEITNILNKALVKIANEKLKNYTLKELIALISE